MSEPGARPMGSGERGGAVLAVLLVGVLISALGLGLVVLSSTERAVAANFQTGVRMIHAAEAAMELALLELASDASWTPVLSGTRVSSFVDTGSRPRAPWGGDVDLTALTATLQLETDASQPYGPDTPRWQRFASGPFRALTGSAYDGPFHLIVWVADDPGDRDADPGADANGVIVVRAQALGGGGMRRTVQVVLRRVGSDIPEDESTGSTTTDDWASGELARIVPSEGGGEAPGVGGVWALSWREVR